MIYPLRLFLKFFLVAVLAYFAHIHFRDTMPWKDQLKRLKGDWDNFNKQHNVLPGSQSSDRPPYPTPPQQSYYGGPPPTLEQPFSGPAPPAYGQGPPTQQPINSIYWQPQFQPGLPVAQEWEPKIGNNNGWGNAELEHYTANPENAFFTNDRKLIIRAIANNSSPSPEQKYTSARLVSRQTLSRDRGFLSAVISSPCASGIWPAFWLLPKEPFAWPGDGEVDIAETWNGDLENRSCLHWGHFTPEDAWKHRTMGTKINDMHGRPVRYDWAWEQPGGNPGQGRMIWWIDGRPVMKAPVPGGTRAMRDWNILLNVAMGGNVCAGQTPRDGAYDMIVHSLYLAEEPDNGGWQRFENDWRQTPDGKTM